MDITFTIFIALIVGIISSLLASYVFLRFLIRCKPKIDIAPIIAKEDLPDGKKMYRFKFINRRKRPAVNIEALLALTYIKDIPGGLLFHDKPIETKTAYEIGKFDTNDEEARYAFQLSFQEDLESLWENASKSFLTLSIRATDSLCGFGKAFRMEYRSKTDIYAGHFKFGNSFEIKK